MNQKQIEARYRAEITSLIQRTLPTLSPEQSFQEWVDELAALSMKPFYAEIAEAIAGRMVVAVNIQNAKTWREAAHRSSQSGMLYRALQAELANSPVGLRFHDIIKQNAQYIRSIPVDIAQTLTAEIAARQQAGARSKTMAKMMALRFPELTKGKINLIARTETAKAATALTRARSEDIGLDWFQWLTSEDSRVRASHKNMDKVLVRWSDLPSPEALIGQKSTLGHYAAGDCPNCRCNSSPFLTLDDISWPARVYWGGSIKRMSRATFLKIAGIPDRRIAA
jgi:SPP1 gp7 family putative phage head morphogenesis protein